ncbi:hypothetical protein [Kangiella sp. TOML190]|uniref:hypothetical protein n=1 Tax=Kangiella sp. TOML190 TaxID=2931351 RepID=UPI00203AC384|nr:hypothetical protein [Kangiella sp. TOML190]
MQKLAFFLSILLLLLISKTASAQLVIYPDFQIPPEYTTKADYNPATYLAKYPVANTGKILSEDKKQKLACLLVATEKSTQAKFKHSFMVDLKQPLIALTMTNFPEIRDMEWGGRRDANVKYMSLSQIAKGVEGSIDKSSCNA